MVGRALGDKFTFEKRKKNLLSYEQLEEALQGWMKSFEEAVQHRDAGGKCAMDYAKQRGLRDVVELLEMAAIRIQLRHKRIQEQNRELEFVACSQVRSMSTMCCYAGPLQHPSFDACMRV